MRAPALTMLDQPAADRLALRLVGRLDHHAHERLRPGGPDQNAATALELRVLLVDRVQSASAPSIASRSATRTFSSRCGRRSNGSTSSSRRPPSARRVSSEAAIPSPRRSEVGPDDVAGLLAAEPPVALEQLLDHVAVAHLGLDDLDPGLLHRVHEPEVGHHRHGHAALELAALLEVQGDQGDQVVAVVQPPLAVDGERPDRRRRRRRSRCRRRTSGPARSGPPDGSSRIRR